ncbi:response regulator [Rhizorhabdus phycosphaerae]|uniref:response regulator n=1 Tax=Rhizorhabdus phycosphaerae TaxID=2711156 RepID=UPI0013EB7723|nr:response regulator [Rhizorhabdus phycosphaerae]
MPDSPVRILAVDDVPQNLVALEAALDQPGVELVTASSGEQALELMLRSDFALALLDVQMPGMDGFELAELMRGTERTRAVPIIFLTAIATDETRRFRGFEAGAVDYLLKPYDIHVLNQKVSVFVELARQRRELARQRDELALALGRLRAHGDNSPMAVVEIDPDLRIVTWAKGAERLFGYAADDMLGLLLHQAPFLPEEDRATFVSSMQRLLEGENSEMQEHRFLRADGALRAGEWYCSTVAGSRGRALSGMLQILDVTERQRAMETQRLLVGELNHRVKNSLATVQAIASQSFRHAEDVAQFRDAFTGRIKSLAAAHSLLSTATWERASLRRLITDQFEIGAVTADRFHMDGPSLDLTPELALRFALVLHELATNAHKYGAFSNDSGHVSLAWRVESDVVLLDWCETGGPTVAPFDKRGFGTTLIQSSLTSEGGRAEMEYRPEGICWHLRLPLRCDDEVNGLQVVDDAPLPTTAPPAPAVVQQQPAPVETGSRQLKILVVEDEPLVAMDLMMELEDSGHWPLGPATSCDQALDIIMADAPDAALLDGNLNGEPVDRVADELASRDIPFAFVSGYGREHLPSRHADRPVISKPFRAAEVLAAVEDLMASPSPSRSAAA